MSPSDPLTVEVSPIADIDEKSRHCTDDEITQMIALHAQGVSVREIAHRLNRRWHTVADQLAKVEDVTNEVANKYLALNKLEAIEAWRKALDVAAGKGDHRPSKELLLHTQVIEPLADAGGGGKVGIQIVVGAGHRAESVQVVDTTGPTPHGVLDA